MGKRKSDFESRVMERRHENSEELRRMLDSKSPSDDLIGKIDKYAKRYDIPVEYVWDKLYQSDGDIELNGFEKDPAKQNIYEMIQLDMVKEIPVIEAVNKLPAGGGNALYVLDGKVVHLSQNERKRYNVKSIDFMWEYHFMDETLYFYSSCKYTNEAGGAQDNQKLDAISSFLTGAMKSTDANIFFFALLDGDYYQLENPTGTKVIDEINEMYKGPRCCAVSIDCLQEEIRKVIIDWLKSKASKHPRETEPEINRINTELKEDDFE